ncbi:uracil phosphoribosyltransferase [Merdibacter massiliensis]|uniref:uracil phosphoribosyltransferase n=1 Tax=Merdibacter massiliensis TaxID=1871030 RepID=UPI00096A39DF|nr:uracil phosphoribosyltransferase [Merdibacter massiliensis]
MYKLIEHPLITHKLTQMRNVETGTKDFRQNLDEVAGLMAYEITRDLPLKPVHITTPVAPCDTYELAKPIILVPILRAGLGMVNGICNLIPTLKVAHIGLYRDEETLQPHTYFEKYPKNIADATVIIVDPMLATGGSAIAAIDMVKKQGATDIRLANIVAAPEGVKAVESAHPDVMIYLAALDDHLNEHGYIVPGLGDCGDRIFGTK